MIFHVGLENNNDDRSIAWALKHPGCFSYGRDAADAEANFPRAAREYIDWIRTHGGTWFPLSTGGSDAAKFHVIVEETFDPGQGSMIEPFFRQDGNPLAVEEIEQAKQLLAWGRAELLAVVGGLSPQVRTRKFEGERWDINGILRHIAGGEWWYQERIGYPSPAREEDLPDDPIQQLAVTREHFERLLPQLQGLQLIVQPEGEFWSPRKVLRRLVWHERDHTDHINKLLNMAQTA